MNCKQKIRHQSKRQAKKAMRSARLRYKRSMFWYYCEECKGYHISKHRGPLKRFENKANGTVWYQAI